MLQQFYETGLNATLVKEFARGYSKTSEALVVIQWLSDNGFDQSFILYALYMPVLFSLVSLWYWHLQKGLP